MRNTIAPMPPACIRSVYFSAAGTVACSACGKTATDNWLLKQKEILPPCLFQHITFTMPKVLSDFFRTNRRLLNRIPALAGKILMRIAGKKGVRAGIFMALHTFGRKLNWNVHLHVSVTQGGLTADTLFFKSHILMKMWRYAVLKLLRTENREGLLNHYPELNGQPLSSVFANQYAKYWRVHCAKPHNNPKKDIEYLGRYIKRPAIANSRLLHYSGTGLVFKYLNHRTKKTEYTQLHPFEFITRCIQHIPEKGFRLIRYFGFLANRVRGKLLPVVHALFNHEPQPKKHSCVLVPM